MTTVDTGLQLPNPPPRQLHVISNRMRTWLVCYRRVAFVPLIMAISSFLVLALPSVEGGRKDAAKSFAKEIQQAHFHKVYVADFLDPSGMRNEQGCFFSSVFSTNLTKSAQDFQVVNRIDAQKKLDELHISAQDLQRPEMLGQAATALGADAILVGSLSMSPKEAKLFVVLRGVASAKEVHSMEYREKLQPSFESSFPAGQTEDGRLYYFPGLDGISQPKCIRCPNPDFTDVARKGIQGGIQRSVLLSAGIDEKGKIKEVRVVSSPDDGMTRLCLDSVRDWRMRPSQDINGNAVPVRTSIEIVFRLLK